MVILLCDFFYQLFLLFQSFQKHPTHVAARFPTLRTNIHAPYLNLFLISLNLHVSVIMIIFLLVMLSSGGFSVVVRFLIVLTCRRRRVAARSIKEFRAAFLNVLWGFFSVKFLSLQITMLSRGCFRICTAHDNLYCCTQIIIITRLLLLRKTIYSLDLSSRVLRAEDRIDRCVCFSFL